MERSICLLFCAVSVSGQFLDTEYSLDSVPLPIRRRVQNTEYEIQPSIWREIRPNAETVGISNQERRHIDNNGRDTPNAQFSTYNDQYYKNQFNGQLQQQNENNRRTNDKSTQNEQRSNTQETSFQNIENQQNYAFNNVQNTNNPTSQHTQNDNNYNSNSHRNPEARAIDSNSYTNSRQNTDSTNNRKFNSKPKKQNTETAYVNNNRNNERDSQTEPTRKFTEDYRYVTGGTKSTEDNELTSKSNAEGRMGGNADDKWIWSNAAAKTTITTAKPSNTTVAVDDRAAFAGDKCPTGQVRFNNMCVNVD